MAASSLLTPTVRTILIQSVDHQPSANLIRLTWVPPTATTPPPAQPLPAWVAHWAQELTVFSVAALLLLVGRSVARHLFRIPFADHLAARSAGPEVAELWPAVRNHGRARLALRRRRVRLPTFTLAPGALAHLSGVAIAGFLVLAPLWGVATAVRLGEARAAVLEAAASGLSSFAEGGAAAVHYDFVAAAASFERAVSRFSEADAELRRVPVLLRAMAEIVPGGEAVASGRHLIAAGAALARVGQNLATGFLFLRHDQLGELPVEPGAALWQRLPGLATAVLPDLDVAERELLAVRIDDVPVNYQAAFQEVRATVPTLRRAAAQLFSLRDVAPKVLGFEDPQRYLIMFQNNYELRATGGFMGSFAVVDVARGEIRRVEIPGGGTYDLQGSLAARLIAPQPLQLINPRWEFQDANWWVDWPTSAQKIAWFYQQGGGSPVNGVLAVDTSFVTALLEMTGPITLPKYDLTITAENFVAETQAEVEQRYDRSRNRPKEFIGDLAPELLTRLQDLADRDSLGLAEAVSRALTEKHLLLYHTDQAVSAPLTALGWTGALATPVPRTDSLAIVHTNIGGGKSDGVIADAVEHLVNVLDDGRLVDTVTLTRTHNGRRGEPFVGVRNVDYLRLYVPVGSRPLAAEGFQAPAPELFSPPPPDLVVDADLARISSPPRPDPATDLTTYEEFGRTVLAGWLMVDPGEQVTVSVTYLLPWNFESGGPSPWETWVATVGGLPVVQSYHFRWEKQPGIAATVFRHQFTSPQPLRVVQSSVPLKLRSNGWQWGATLRSDDLLSVAFTD